MLVASKNLVQKKQTQVWSIVRFGIRLVPSSYIYRGEMYMYVAWTYITRFLKK